MHDEHPHPLLAQVPLTLSPFLNLPTATPLPYSYKQLPSTLPPSLLSPSTNITSPDPTSAYQQHQHPPAYVTSQSGASAHPDQILETCLALQVHLRKLETDAKATLGHFEERRRRADLEEKRRVAPGWLDGDVKILVPENVGREAKGGEGKVEDGDGGRPSAADRRPESGGLVDTEEGKALDRAFGGLGI